MTAKVTALHTSNGGVPKLPVVVLTVTKDGCIGDKQNDRKHHGGPNKAVCLFLEEIIEELALEGHPIAAGTTGENVLIRGIPRYDLNPGVVLKFPDVDLAITQDAPPCRTIIGSFSDNDFNLISHKKFPNRTRWYAKVLREGTISVDDVVKVIN